MDTTRSQINVDKKYKVCFIDRNLVLAPDPTMLADSPAKSVIEATLTDNAAANMETEVADKSERSKAFGIWGK